MSPYFIAVLFQRKDTHFVFRLHGNHMTKMRFNKDAFGIVLFTTLSGNNIKRRVNMVLDTGATYSMMPWYIAEELNYDPKNIYM